MSENVKQQRGRIEEGRMDDMEVEDVEPASMPRQTRKLTMIYLLFLAEAIMASSLSAQIAILTPSATGCMTMDSAFLRSVFECAYFAGSTAGVAWGWTADRWGRRSVVLCGLAGMATCCVLMGFATNFTAFAALRFTAGLVSSAVTVAGLSMLADVTHGDKGRAWAVAKLPLVAFCGSLGPLAASGVRKLSEAHGVTVLALYPGLSGQLACASLVTMIALAEALLLEETLPSDAANALVNDGEYDCEKAGLLGQSLSNGSEESLGITLVEALNDDAATPLNSRITVSQLLSAPSALVLLASLSALSLHSSTFDILLPHISHTASHEGGLGLPCSWLSTIKLLIAFGAAIRIAKLVPRVIERVGLLKMYRRMSWAFPVLYTLIPLAGLAVSRANLDAVVAAGVSVLAMLIKATLTGAAQVLVVLLILSAAPDAQSTGTTIGVLSIAELFKALAVGVSGIAYYLSDDYSMLLVNGSLWAALAAIALVGAIVTRQLRETPRVGTDIPAQCLVWQGMFDADSDEEAGF